MIMMNMLMITMLTIITMITSKIYLVDVANTCIASAQIFVVNANTEN